MSYPPLGPLGCDSHKFHDTVAVLALWSANPIDSVCDVAVGAAGRIGNRIRALRLDVVGYLQNDGQAVCALHVVRGVYSSATWDNSPGNIFTTPTDTTAMILPGRVDAFQDLYSDMYVMGSSGISSASSSVTMVPVRFSVNLNCDIEYAGAFAQPVHGGICLVGLANDASIAGNNFNFSYRARLHYEDY